MSVAAKAVEKYYQDAREPRYDHRELRLSETGDCARKRVLKAMGVPQTHQIPEAALRVMETGNLWEQWLIKRIEETAIAFSAQVEVRTMYGASGHIDLMVLGGDGPEINEVKAVSMWAKAMPDPKHVDQVQAYLHFHGRHHRIARARILYIHRDNGQGPFEYVIDYDPARGAAIEADLAILRGMVDAGDVPPIPEGHTPTSFPCWYESKQQKYQVHCQWFGHCWGSTQ